MKLLIRSLFIFIGSLLLVTSIACQQGGDSSNSGKSPGATGPGGGGNPGDGPVKPMSCDEAWKQRLELNKLGRLEKRETKTFRVIHLANNEGPAQEKELQSQSIHTSEVTENTEDHFTVVESTETLYPRRDRSDGQSITTKRDEVLNLCKTVSPHQPNPNTGVEIVVIGEEKITVPAGTFLCIHTKITSTRNGKFITHSWTAKNQHDLLVKSISSMKNEYEGNSVESITESELIEFKN